MLAFTLNDSGIKWLSGDYPLHEVVFFRATTAILFTLTIFLPIEGGLKNLRTKRLPMHFLRGLCVVFANMMFFMGLASLKVSDATAIFFVSPLIITLFSVLFLSERVGPWRWAGVFVGLIGVVVMVRPGTQSFQFAALFPIIAAIAYATLNTLTRKMGQTETASTMAFYIQLTFIVISAGIGLALGDGKFSGSSDPSIEFILRAWVWPTLPDFAVMVFLGAASALGGYLISQAYRLCEASVVAPFEYVAMPMAILWGFLLFGDLPDAVAWIGIILITGSGLFVFWRETVTKNKIVGGPALPRNR